VPADQQPNSSVSHKTEKRFALGGLLNTWLDAFGGTGGLIPVTDLGRFQVVHFVGTSFAKLSIKIP
jgi:hypothetical protein